jgi:hypothetical protein
LLFLPRISTWPDWGSRSHKNKKIDESCGNQSCQWSGTKLQFRVPYCLENKYGKYVETNLDVWSALHQLNKLIGQCPVINRRHDYYRISNWEPLVKVNVEHKPDICQA